MWNAISEIVRAFLDKGHHRLAFSIVPMALVGFVIAVSLVTHSAVVGVEYFRDLMH
jgi:hypothetical protein